MIWYIQHENDVVDIQVNDCKSMESGYERCHEKDLTMVDEELGVSIAIMSGPKSYFGQNLRRKQSVWSILTTVKTIVSSKTWNWSVRFTVIHEIILFEYYEHFNYSCFVQYAWWWSTETSRIYPLKVGTRLQWLFLWKLTWMVRYDWVSSQIDDERILYNPLPRQITQ